MTMHYTVNNTFHAGRPVEKFIDGKGVEYTRDTLEVDTDTGVMIRFARDNNGEQLIQGGEFVRESFLVPLPVRAVFKDR